MLALEGVLLVFYRIDPCFWFRLRFSMGTPRQDIVNTMSKQQNNGKINDSQQFQKQKGATIDDYLKEEKRSMQKDTVSNMFKTHKHKVERTD